jgi:uncharacterized protein (DUF342 family)
MNSNVAGQVAKIKVRYEKFLDMVKTVDTSTNTEFKDLSKSLTKDLRNTEKNVKDLKEAVSQVEKNRDKFPLIKDAELSVRKKFVDDNQRALNGILNSPTSKPTVYPDI